jgi:hypothetical protein
MFELVVRVIGLEPIVSLSFIKIINFHNVIIMNYLYSN